MVLLGLSLFAFSADASAGTLGTWTAPVSVDPANANPEISNQLASVSCVSGPFCAAVDISGFAVADTAGKWTAPVGADISLDSGELASVSCASSKFCAAVDSYGNLVTWNGRAWSGPTGFAVPSGSGADGLNAVSCVPNTSYCVAVGYGGVVATYNAGTTASANVDSDRDLTSVSCPSKSFCVAVDESGDALTYNGSSGWSQPTPVDAGTTLTSVSCSSTSFCIAVANMYYAFTYDGSTWGPPIAMDSNAFLQSVSCAPGTINFCVAVDTSGYAETYQGQLGWGKPVRIDSKAVPQAVSCSSGTFCAAVDDEGNALTYRGGRTPAADRTSTSVACAPASVAVGASTSCTATVRDTASGGTTPTGTVSFASTPTTGAFFGSGDCALQPTSTIGTASCEVSLTPSAVGLYDVTASYAGENNYYEASTSPSFTQTATGPLATSVTCAPLSVTVGKASTCKATVTDTESSGATTPTGTVSFSTSLTTGTFADSGHCTLAAVAGTTDMASCAVSFRAAKAGVYAITAAYGGDAGHEPGNSPPSTVKALAPPTPSIGRAKVSGTSVRVPVKCSGSESCAVKITLTTTETTSHDGKTTKKTVVVGSKSVTVAAPKSVTVKLSLNTLGKRLLAKSQTLKGRLTATFKGKTVGSTKLRFTTKR